MGSLFTCFVERKQDSSDKGVAPFHSGEEYMTIALRKQYQSQGKLVLSSAAEYDQKLYLTPASVIPEASYRAASRG